MNRPTRIGHRLFAFLCTALVLALGAVAADNRLHARLHAQPAECEHGKSAHGELPVPGDSHETSCAVELFAAGVSVPVDPTHQVVAPLGIRGSAPDIGAEASVRDPAHLLPPGRGPPQG